jgi:hypothetical protein
MLRLKYGANRFEHHIINIDPLFKFVSYESYLSDLRKHGFMVLSVCGLCKLAMHLRAARFCLDHGIKHVSDGANRGMALFPDQTPEVIRELAALYRASGIEYSNPVFHHEPPEEGSFIKFENQHLLRTLSQTAGSRQVPDSGPEGTTGWRLHKLGLAPLPNVKGTPYDRKRQPRCFQFVLFKVMVKKHYLGKESLAAYSLRSQRYFGEKISRMAGLLASGDRRLRRALD